MEIAIFNNFMLIMNIVQNDEDEDDTGNDNNGNNDDSYSRKLLEFLHRMHQEGCPWKE